MNADDLESITNFVYEAGILAHTPRSGLWFLGTGEQSVAEHSLRSAFIAYALASMTTGVDQHRTVLIALFHDFAEGRTSDHNYVHQKYGRLAEAVAIDDIAETVPFGSEIKKYYEEGVKKETREAQLAKDADQLEWIATLREEEVKGNAKATSWLKSAVQRIRTPAGKKLVQRLMQIHPDAWWYREDDPWFVDRKKNEKQK